MDPIIKEIFYSDAVQRNWCITDPRYRPVSKQACGLEKKLKETLSEKQSAAFQEFLDARIEAANIEQTEYFMRGLSTGARLMIEILREPEE